MSIRETFKGDLVQINFPNRNLVFLESSKIVKVLQERKLLHEFLKAEDLAQKEGFAESENIKVTRFDRNSKYPQHALYFKVESGEGTFFVKKTPLKSLKDFGGGTGEVFSSREALELISKADKSLVGEVKVVEFAFGVVDKTKKEAYFVSGWDDVYSNGLDKYFKKLDEQINEAEGNKERLLELKNKKKSLKSRSHWINKILREAGYFDLKNEHLAYNEETDTIYLFDLNKKIEQPLGA